MLERGRIISAEVPDENGRNPKSRPLVVLTKSGEIKATEPFWCVAITGELPVNPGDEWVLLPYQHSPPHPRTGLTKRCAAKCDWLVPIMIGEVKEERGWVPGKQLREIVEKTGVLP